MLNTTDTLEDPEESWSNIEHEMERLLTTIDNLQQPNRIADIERKLLGVVLKEENIDKIEQIREEYKRNGDDIANNSIDNESSEKQLGNNTQKQLNNDNIQTQYRDGNCVTDTDIGNIVKECCEKYVQIDIVEGNTLEQVRMQQSFIYRNIIVF